jgi:hypothetical protein
MISNGFVALALAALMMCCAGTATDTGKGPAAAPSIAAAKPPRPHCRIYFGCVPAARTVPASSQN